MTSDGGVRYFGRIMEAYFVSQESPLFQHNKAVKIYEIVTL